MLLLYAIGILLAVFAFDSLRVISVHRYFHGRFEIVMDTHRMFAFRSSSGTFTLRHDLGPLQYQMNDRQGSLPLQDIDAIEVGQSIDDATLAELFIGTDFMDPWPQYRDSVEWHWIAVVTMAGERIVLYRSGQYRQRQYLHTFYIELQWVVLETMGFIADVDTERRAAFGLIRSKLVHPRIVHVDD